jgi:hypothetical protein
VSKTELVLRGLVGNHHPAPSRGLPRLWTKKTIEEGDEAQCFATAALRVGQTTAQGIICGVPESLLQAITGGTGKYEGAEGELHVVW